MVLGGGTSSLDPRYQPQLKAASQSGGLTHGTFQTFMSQHTTSGRMPAARATDYRTVKRAREDDGETLVSKHLHKASTRDVSQLLHQRGINIRPAEPEPEPQRATSAANINAMPAAVRASCVRSLHARLQWLDPAPLPCRWIPSSRGNINAHFSLRLWDHCCQLGQLRKRRLHSIAATRHPLPPAQRIWICHVNSRSLLTRPRCACWMRCVLWARTTSLPVFAHDLISSASIPSLATSPVAVSSLSTLSLPFCQLASVASLACCPRLTPWPTCREQAEVGALLFDRGQHFPVRPMTRTPASGQSTFTV
jgi:hypothetical protein